MLIKFNLQLNYCKLLKCTNFIKVKNKVLHKLLRTIL